MSAEVKETRYKKILIDNARCKRRFHLVCEEGSEPQAKVEVPCPYCGVIIFQETNFPAVSLAREENLINSPDGSVPIINQCKFPGVP